MTPFEYRWNFFFIFVFYFYFVFHLNVSCKIVDRTKFLPFLWYKKRRIHPEIGKRSDCVMGNHILNWPVYSVRQSILYRNDVNEQPDSIQRKILFSFILRFSWRRIPLISSVEWIHTAVLVIYWLFRMRKWETKMFCEYL